MDEVRNVLAKTFRVKSEDIKDTTTVGDIDTWDSLTHMEMVANLETELGIEFDGDEIAEMTNVKKIEEIVKAKK